MVWVMEVYKKNFIHSKKAFCIIFQKKDVENSVVPNMQAVLSDFRIIGEGLVKDVKVKNLPL